MVRVVESYTDGEQKTIGGSPTRTRSFHRLPEEAAYDFGRVVFEGVRARSLAWAGCASEAFSGAPTNLVRPAYPLQGVLQDEGGNVIGAAVDVFEEEGLLVVEVMLPGVRVEDLSLNACGSRLLLWARRSEGDGERHYRVRATRLAPWVSEEVVLPPQARTAEATARLKHGVLQVRIPLSGGTCEAVRPIPVVE